MTESVKNELSDICRIIDATVDTEKIYLFGSYAYGTPTDDSDYDLCVIIPENSMRPADAVKAIRRALFSAQSVPLDVIVYRSNAFHQRAEHASLERKIAREGVLLYEHRLEQRMALLCLYGSQRRGTSADDASAACGNYLLSL